MHALAAELERLDRVVEITPTALDQAGRAKRFEDLQRQRARLSVAIGELQSKLVNKYGPLAGQVAGLKAIQSSLPGDAALITWVDIPPVGPGAADPDGEHWGVIVRSEGAPVWVPIAGSGPSGLWTGDDFTLAQRAGADCGTRRLRARQKSWPHWSRNYEFNGSIRSRSAGHDSAPADRPALSSDGRRSLGGASRP